MHDKKILIVDDEVQLVLMLKFRLKTMGYEVLEAYNGEEGLRVARREKPDLILLDIMLPMKDGYEVCLELKNDPGYSDIPIVLFSAKTEEADIEKGEKVGADAYITKPFESTVLVDKIEELLVKMG